MNQEFSDDVYAYIESLSDDEREELIMEAVQGMIEDSSKNFEVTPELRDLINSLSVEHVHTPRINERYLRRMANSKEPLSPENVRMIARLAGKDESGFSPHEFDGDDNGITDEMLEGYAKHIRNYLYRYKDEATGIDPNIDPDEEHKGPMAQDIEQVAPDCVKETPEGVKTVDGSRLSLVNAGVIGELARRVLDLEEKINGNRI